MFYRGSKSLFIWKKKKRREELSVAESESELVRDINMHILLNQWTVIKVKMINKRNRLFKYSNNLLLEEIRSVHKLMWFQVAICTANRWWRWWWCCTKGSPLPPSSRATQRRCENDWLLLFWSVTVRVWESLTSALPVTKVWELSDCVKLYRDTR